jgi:hypothetical protein
VFGYYSARRCTEELYDLRSDPGEIQNVVDDPAHAAALTELRSALDAHLAVTDDPFQNLRNDLLMQEETYEAIRRSRFG